MFRKNKLRAIAALLILALIMGMTSCGIAGSDSSDRDVETLTATISKDPKFDSAVLSLTEEDFSEAGFALGDSFYVEFSNGYSLTDVPYYNGYYVKTGNPVIVAYPKNEYVLIAANNRDFWTPAGLEDGDTVEITLTTAGKYKATHEALGQSYSMDRKDYESDEAFANFRAMSGGSLKENFLYRGASPVDNSRNRAAIADALVEQAGITCIIDLADSEAEMEGYIGSEDFSSEYTKSLYEEGRDVLLAMGANYDSEEYKESVAAGMRHLLKYGGPAYIHCMEGKDRTGFVCLLIEALMGADYDEMRADYMKTYENYYGITEQGTPERYEAVLSLYFDSFMEYLARIEGTADTADTAKLKSADYVKGAKSYLTDCGMTDKEIARLLELLSK